MKLSNFVELDLKITFFFHPTWSCTETAEENDSYLRKDCGFSANMLLPQSARHIHCKDETLGFFPITKADRSPALTFFLTPSKHPRVEEERLQGSLTDRPPFQPRSNIANETSEPLMPHSRHSRAHPSERLLRQPCR